MSELHDIWNNGKGKLSDEQIVAYLEGKLTAAEKYEVERLLSEEGLESDALEGLRFISPEATRASADKINHKLQHLTQKRKRRTSLFNDNKWTWIAIAIILFLCILGYWVLYIVNK
jgi:hypothetical protein